jgi:hypothetical protein
MRVSIGPAFSVSVTDLVPPVNTGPDEPVGPEACVQPSAPDVRAVKV